jgi:hypothetical protein
MNAGLLGLAFGDTTSVSPRRPSFIAVQSTERNTRVMAESETVYVGLLDEGVEVWRPVASTRLADGMYRLTDDAPDDECWEFPPGSIVVAEERNLDGGPTLVALRLAD